MTATINGNRYRIEFSYRRREGKRASLARNSPIAGVTACAIVADGGPEFSPVVSVAASICSASDNWSRREGRWHAFERAVVECGILCKDASAFMQWFSERFPVRVKAGRQRTRLSAEEIERRRREGRDVARERTRKDDA